MYKNYIIIFWLSVIAVAQYQIPNCTNQGQPILTRTNYQPYFLSYKCLCPFDFYGEYCENHRTIYCQSLNPTIQSYNISEKRTVKLGFEMRCLLVDREIKPPDNQSDSSYYRQKKKYTLLPTSEQKLIQQYEDNNYYIDTDLKIIWANDTDMFTEDGQLIRQDINDTRTDDEVLDDYEPYQFDYKSQIFSVPMSQSTLSYSVKSYRFSNKTLSLGNVQPQIRPLLDLKGKQLGYRAKFEIETKQEMEEYGVTRIQLDLLQYYGTFQTMHHVLMDNPKWLLFNKNSIEKGNYLGGGQSISSSVWMLLVTVVIIVGIFSMRIILKKYKKWKKKRLLTQLEQQSNMVD